MLNQNDLVHMNDRQADKRIKKFDDRYLPHYAEIYVEDIDLDTVLAAQDTYYQIVAWSTAGAGNNGHYHGAVPDATNDHITIASDGFYFIHWSMSVYSAVANEYEFEIFTNNGAVSFPQTEGYRTTSAANAVGLATGGGICKLNNGDTVELWISRKDGGAVSKTITIREASIVVWRIGLWKSQL